MADVTQSPGWYPDPEGGAGQRWWNGAGWSDSRRGGSAATAATPPTPSIIYSADNPAPQRPDPGTAPVRAVWTVKPQVNSNATIGLAMGIIALFMNLFYLLGVVAIVFSALGIVRARKLRAQGAPRTLMGLALIGVALGTIATVIAIVTIVATITGSVSVNLS